MILLISGSNSGREIANVLEGEAHDVMVAVETIIDAAKFSNKNVVVIKMNKNGIFKTIKENNISGVVDASGVLEPTLSSEAVLACRKAAVPYVKFERKILDFNEYAFVTEYNSQKDMTDVINKTLGNVMLMMNETATNEIIDNLIAVSNVYVPILKGSYVSFADHIKYNLPPSNIAEVDGFESEIQNLNTLRRYDIKLLVIQESTNALDKIKAAHRYNTDVAVYNPKFVDYPCVVSCYKGILDTVKSWKEKE